MSGAGEAQGSQGAFDLIVTIVPVGDADMVIEAAAEAGAEGATVLHGRGTGIHEKKKILGVPIQPEKEVVYTLVPQAISEQVLDAIVAATELQKPGHGIAFVIDAKRVAGISHLGKEPTK